MLVRAGSIRGYKNLARRLGGDPDALMARVGLRAEAFDDEDTLVPARALAQLLEISAQVLECPDLGLRLAEEQDLSVLGPLAVAIQHSATVAESLRCAARYLFVHSSAVSLTVVPSLPEQPHLAELRYEFVLPRLGSIRQATDLTLAFAHRMTALVARGRYRVQAVRLPYTPRASVARYVRCFGAPVEFDQPHASLLVPADLLKRPLETANETLRELASNYLETNFPDAGQPTSARVRMAVSRCLGMTAARKEQIAAALAMHPRTLQRHLAAEGTSFEAIRDEICSRAALRYLTSPRLPLSQIAGLLGLSEQSALTRACKRWFDSTPTAIRRAALAGDALAAENVLRPAPDAAP